MADTDLNRVMNGYISARDAAEYEEALVLDEEQITADDYRMVWTDTYSGDYPPVK